MTEDMNQKDKPEQSVEVVEPVQLDNSTTGVGDNLKNLTQLVYILQAISLVVGVTAIAGLILNYLKRDEVRGTFLEAHFAWQIKTFWYAFVGFILGWPSMMVRSPDHALS